MGDEKKVKQSITRLFELYRSHFGDSEYKKLLELYESGDEVEVKKRLASIPQTFQRPTGSALETLLKPQGAVTDATTVTQGDLEGYKVPSQTDTSLFRTQIQPARQTTTAEDIEKALQTQQQKAIEEEAEKISNSYDFIDKVLLSAKNISSSFADMFADTFQSVAMLTLKGAEISGKLSPEQATNIFDIVHKTTGFGKTWYKLQLGITDADRIMMRGTLDQQVANALGSILAFSVGALLTGSSSAWIRAGGYALQTAMAGLEGFQESSKAFDETKSLDLATNLYIASLPAAGLEYVSDRAAIFRSISKIKELGSPAVKSFRDKLLAFSLLGAENFTREFFTEPTQQIIVNFTAKELYDYNRDLMANVTEQALPSGIAGLLFGNSVAMIQYTLDNKQLTQEERLLLETQRNDILKLVNKLGSLEEIENKITSWRLGQVQTVVNLKENDKTLLEKQIGITKPKEAEIWIRDEGKASQMVKDAILQSRLEAQEGLDRDELQVKKAQSKILYEESTQPLEKIKAGIEFSIYTALESASDFKEFSNKVISEVGDKVKPALPTIYQLTKTAFGGALLYYAIQNGMLNDPTVMGALMIPAWMTKKATAENFTVTPQVIEDNILFNIDIKEGEEANVISTKDVRLNKSYKGEATTLDNVLSGKFLEIYPEFKQIKVMALPKLAKTWVNGRYVHQDNAIYLNPIFFSDTVSDEVKKQWIKGSKFSAYLDKVPIDVLWEANKVSTILHELQHNIETIAGWYSGGSTNTYQILPNQLLNKFVLDNYNHFVDFANILELLIDNAKAEHEAYQYDIETIFGKPYKEALSTINLVRKNIADLLEIAAYVTAADLRWLSNPDGAVYDAYERLLKTVGNPSIYNINPQALRNDIAVVLRAIEKYGDNLVGAYTVAEEISDNLRRYLRNTSDNELGMKVLLVTTNVLENLPPSSLTNKLKRRIIDIKYNIYKNLIGEKRAFATETQYAYELLEDATPEQIAEKLQKRLSGKEAGDIAYKDKGEVPFDILMRTLSVQTESNRIYKNAATQLKSKGFVINGLTDKFALVYHKDAPISYSILDITRQDAAEETLKNYDYVKVAVALNNLLIQEGITIPIGNIYSYIRATQMSVLPPKEELPNVVNAIREFSKTYTPQIDGVLITHYTELATTILPETKKVKYVKLDPDIAWANSHDYSKYSKMLDFPRLFFYVLSNVNTYKDKLEVRIVSSGKRPTHAFIPKSDIYFLDEFEGDASVPVNPLNLSVNSVPEYEAAFGIIKNAGYKGAYYNVDGLEHIVLFQPIVTYTAPTYRLGITAHKSEGATEEIAEASNKFSEKYKTTKEIDEEALETIVEATEEALEENLVDNYKKISHIETVANAVAVFGDEAEASTFIEVTTDIALTPQFLARVTKAADKLKQDAVHIILDGDKPAGVNYGEVQPDLSMWQPQVTVVFDEIGYGDISKITKIFTDVGFAGVTVSPDEGIAYIYNIGRSQDEIQSFLESAAKLGEAIKSEFPDTNIDVRLSDVKLWSFGKSDSSWGTTATYSEVQDTFLTEKPNEIIRGVLDNEYQKWAKIVVPDTKDKLTMQWQNIVDQSQEILSQLDITDIENGNAALSLGIVALHEAINNGTDIKTEINKIAKSDIRLLPVTLEAEKIAEEKAKRYEPYITVKEAREIYNVIGDYYNNPRAITKRVGDVVITTNREDAGDGYTIYIREVKPTEVFQDETFISEVKDILIEKFGLVAYTNLNNKYEHIEPIERLRIISAILSDKNPAYNLDNLARKYQLANADKYSSDLVLLYKQGDEIIEKDIGINIQLGQIITAKQNENPYAVLELLSYLNNAPMINKIKLNDIDLTDIVLPDKEVASIWAKLTEGVVNPNQLLDFTSILSGLIRLGWNLLKLGYRTMADFTAKLGDIIGDKAKEIANDLYKVLVKMIAQSKPSVTKSPRDILAQILPNNDIRRLAEGTPEGSTQGFSEENLAKPIREKLDDIIENLVQALEKQKRGRVPMLEAKKVAMNLISDGIVKHEDIDNIKIGTIMPAEYVIAYRVLAENSLVNDIEGLKQLEQQYGGFNNVPSNILDAATDNLLSDITRWAKVRAMISESGRVVRLATEEFDSYADVVTALLEKMGADQDLIDKVKNPKDKSVDWLGLVLYNFVLSSPATHVVNFMGNTFHLMLNVGMDILFNPARALDFMVGLSRGIYRAKAEIKEMLQGIKEESNKYFDLQSTEGDKQYWKLLLPTTWLSMSDAVFRNIATEYKIRAVGRHLESHNIVKNAVDLLYELSENPDAALEKFSENDINKAMQGLQYAEYWGKFITYQLPAESKIGEAFISFSQHPLTRLIVMFARTPLNILKAGSHFSPFGLIGVNRVFRQMIKASDEEALRYELEWRDRWKRTLVGTTIFTALAYGMADGLLKITTDEPDDEYERELLAKRGFKPYHIYIRQDDGSYKGFSYRGIEPISFVISLTASLYDVYVNPQTYKLANDESILRRASFVLSQLWNNISDATFMTGINEWYRTQESTKSASEYLERLIVNLLVPNAFTFQKELPDAWRELLNARGKEIYLSETIWDRFKAKIGFGLQDDLTPRYDFFGDKVYNKFERFPFVITEAGKTNTDDEKMLEWLDKHRLVVPSLKQDRILDEYSKFAAFKEELSQIIGKRMKQEIKEIIADFDEEEYYDSLTEQAKKVYGDIPEVQIYKTLGQIEIDSKLQEKIERRYNRIRKEVIDEVLDIDVYKDLKLSRRLSEEQIPQVEAEKEKEALKVILDKARQKILELEFKKEK